MTLKASDLSVNMRVKVKKEELLNFKMDFAKKLSDREGIILWVSKFDTRKEQAEKEPSYAHHINRVQVEFQKKNGRGKVFTEMMDPRYLEIVSD